MKLKQKLKEMKEQFIYFMKGYITMNEYVKQKVFGVKQ
jgi:hypothetical protein